MSAQFRIWRRRLQVALALLVAAAAVLVLLAGWLCGIGSLVRIRPEYPAIVPTTAICFALLGAATAFANASHPRKITRVRVLLAVVALLVAVNLVLSYFVGAGLDQMLPLALHRGDGMAAGTMGGLLMAAYCVDCIAHDRPPRADMSGIAAVMGLTMSFAVIAAHSFDRGSDGAVRWFEQTFPLTAGLFLVLFCALALPSGHPGTPDDMPWDSRLR